MPDSREKAILSLLGKYDSLGVAFSGGVDSSLLLVLAQAALPGRVTAFTVDSPLVPERELTKARAFTRKRGIPHVTVKGNMLADPDFTRNAPDRCYVCKKQSLELILDEARKRGLAALVHGENADDAADFRPGSRAAKELRVEAPLALAGMTKAGVRELARKLKLSTAEKPSMACLASRIPFGEPVTRQKLAAVEAAEEALQEAGLAQYRVRHHGDTARIEVLPADLERLVREPLRTHILERLHKIGFKHVALDLAGYRTGSLNPDQSPS